MRKMIGKIRRGIKGIRDTLTEQVPPLPETGKHSVGTSVQGRDISYYQIGSGRQKVLFVSAIHGNEVGTTKLAHFLIECLQKYKSSYADFTFYVVPCLNPDGQARARRHPNFFNDGRIGRLNANNVDLNRNFPTKNFQSRSNWTHGKNYQELTEVFCGETGGSEPEMQALTGFITKNHITTYFGFHSAGRDVMGNDNPLAQKLANIFSKATGYKLSELREWRKLRQTGTAKDWCDEQGIAYIEIEASVRWGSDWDAQQKGIQACLAFLSS